MSNRVRESNTLQIWGNKDSMNMNSMILTNIQSSTYFKQKLFELKTYHEVIDEIYYRVNHLEPWEKGSRRTQGLTGMCGGVRGVGGGGIVSTAFCLLYKLYTIKMTRKQVIGLITHQDSPYIRALGFMYVRYTQNPSDLLHWYFDYLDDEEELDVRAGGGHLITIGQMLKQWLTKLEWFDTLFPRIPVPIQNEIFDALQSKYGSRMDTVAFYDTNSSKSTGRESSSRSASKRTPPPEIAEVIKKSRSSRSESRGRSDSKGRCRRSRSRSLKRKSDEKSKKRSHRSRSRSTSSRSRSRSSHSSHSDRERRKHRHRKHTPKRSDKDEERHKHRHHHKHSRHHDDEDDREKRKKDENKHSKDKESKAKKESKKNETDSDST